MAATAVKDKDLQALVGRLKEGYDVEADGKGHYKLRGPDGKLVRAGNGRPLTLPSTPSDVRTKRITEAQLRGAGVLKPRRRKRPQQTRIDVGLQRDRARASLDAEGRALEGNRLHADMEKWISRVGGWEARGMHSDLAAIVTFLRTGEPSPSRTPGAQPSVSRFVRGEFDSTALLTTLREIHDRISGDSDPIAAWFDLVREARGIKPRGVGRDAMTEWPFQVKLLARRQLILDESYQRAAKPQFVRDLVLRFDERLVGTLDVSDRGGGSYAILDGNQRNTAMEQLGKQRCWCAIYEGMTVKDEAEFFLHKNRDRQVVHPYYHLRARIVAGHEDALHIERIVGDHGFKLATSSGSPDSLAAIKSVEAIYHLQSDVRENLLGATLQLVREVFLGRKGATDAEMLRGVAAFLARFSDSEIRWDHWKDALAASGPALIRGRARDATPSGRGESGYAIARVLVEVHNTGLPRGQRLDAKRLESPWSGLVRQ